MKCEITVILNQLFYIILRVILYGKIMPVILRLNPDYSTYATYNQFYRNTCQVSYCLTSHFSLTFEGFFITFLQAHSSVVHHNLVCKYYRIRIEVRWLIQSAGPMCIVVRGSSLSFDMIFFFFFCIFLVFWFFFFFLVIREWASKVCECTLFCLYVLPILRN